MNAHDGFLNEAELPFRYCPGCTHGPVLKALTQALDRTQLPHHKVVVVTDIGCVGLADRYLSCSTFHGLHGRSIAYAMGLKLARPELTVVALIGDGGVGIGAGHLIAAARRNVGIAVVVFNNFNFGMTGGQHSMTSFLGARTATTPDGNFERPLDIAALAGAAGATFVARVSGLDKELPEILGEAVSHRGFALVDAWELCTAHFMPSNDFRKAELDSALANVKRGVLVRREEPEYASVVHEHARRAAPTIDPLRRFRVETDGSRATLDQPVGVVIAGSAGMKIRYAASLLARAGIHSGLQAAQQDEFPITVLSGYSSADVILSPTPIHHLSCDPADVLLALTDEGYARFLSRGRTAARIYRLDAVAAKTPGERIIAGPSGMKREYLALHGLAQMMASEELLPTGALRAAVERHGYHGKDGRELEAQLRALA